MRNSEYTARPWQGYSCSTRDAHSNVSAQLVCAGHTDHGMAWGNLQLTYYTCQSARLASISCWQERWLRWATLYALIINAPRRKSTESKFQNSTLDVGKHHGGPWAYRDTDSFKFVPTAAGPGAPGGPGWDSPCTVCSFPLCLLISD